MRTRLKLRDGGRIGRGPGSKANRRQSLGRFRLFAFHYVIIGRRSSGDIRDVARTDLIIFSEFKDLFQSSSVGPDHIGRRRGL